MHFMAFMGHLSTLMLLEISQALSVLSPVMIAPLGHLSAQSSHLSQKACTPKSIGASTSRGRSVKTLQILTRGPYSSVISCPCLPSSPKPASIARGISNAKSLPEGIA